MATTEAATETRVVRDPVCGMTVDPDAGKPRHEHDGHVYHFCSAGCREKFAAEPEKYIEAVDPVCGMKVDRSAAKHMAKHAGERFYFCSARCQEKFEAEPETYLKGRPDARADAGGHDLHLPDAPRDRAGRPRRLPDLRHGAGAEGRARRRRGAEPRAGRLPPPLRRRRGADGAAADPRDGADGRPAGRRVDRRAHRALARADPGDAGHPLVRLAVPGARLRSRSAP